jgi:hypothetical protein
MLQRPGPNRLPEVHQRPGDSEELAEEANPIADRKLLLGIDRKPERGDDPGCFANSRQLGCVLRGEAAELGDHAIEVPVEGNGEAIANVEVSLPGLQGAQPDAPGDAELVVQLAEGSAREPLDAAIHDVAPAFPGRADSAESQVVLDDRDLVAVAKGVATRRQTGQATAHDHDMLVSHRWYSSAARVQARDHAELRTLPSAHTGHRLFDGGARSRQYEKRAPALRARPVTAEVRGDRGAWHPVTARSGCRTRKPAGVARISSGAKAKRWRGQCIW